MVDYPKNKTLHHLLTEQALKAPKRRLFAYDNEIDEASENGLRNYILTQLNIAIELF